MQTKLQSAVETAVNTTAGFVGSWALTVLCWDFGALAIVIACTVWSVARGYMVRRIFNALYP